MRKIIRDASNAGARLEGPAAEQKDLLCETRRAISPPGQTLARRGSEQPLRRGGCRPAQNPEWVPTDSCSPANNTFRAPAFAGSGAAYLALLQWSAGPIPRSSLRKKNSGLKPAARTGLRKPSCPQHTARNPRPEDGNEAAISAPSFPFGLEPSKNADPWPARLPCWCPATTTTQQQKPPRVGYPPSTSATATSGLYSRHLGVQNRKANGPASLCWRGKEGVSETDPCQQQPPPLATASPGSWSDVPAVGCWLHGRLAQPIHPQPC